MMLTKRLLALLLALCCVFALIPSVPVSASAERSGSGSIPFQVNPLYEGLIDEDPLEVQVSHTPAFANAGFDYGSISEAAKQMRKAMVNRDSTITVYYTTTNHDVESTVYEVSDLAVAHTGTPDEGDYLLFTHGGWKGSYSWYYLDGTYYVEASYSPYYYTTAKQEAVMDDYVDDVLDELDLYDHSDYQKIRGIYDYITETVRYDYTHLEDTSYTLQFTAYAALVNKTAVCQGYSNLFYRLALELDVDVRTISGYGNGPHAWNITALDGLWYNLDTTWDEGTVDHSWFLLSPDHFYDHYRDSEYDTSDFNAKYPMDAEDYQYDEVKSNIQIVKQPKSVTVEEGKTAKVSVEAHGDHLKYQWYVKDPGKDKYTKSSCTEPTYSAKITAEKSGRLVYCQITDKDGHKLKTKTVSLKIKDGLTITQQPKGVAVGDGETAKVTVKATGSGLKYQWYFKDPGKSSYSKSSVTSSTYSAKMTEAKSGRRVLCKVTDKNGKTVKSDSVVLSVIDITKQAKGVAVEEGTKASVAIKASGDGLKFQWYIKNPGASKFSKSSVTKSTYSCTMSDSVSGRQAYCKITDEHGNSVNTKTVTLSQITITKQPKKASVEEGKTAKVTVSASGDELTYQWYVKNPGKGSFSKSSITGKTYSCKMTEKISGRQVYCKITDSYGNSVKTKTVALSVK